MLEKNMDKIKNFNKKKLKKKHKNILNTCIMLFMCCIDSQTFLYDYRGLCGLGPLCHGRSVRLWPVSENLLRRRSAVECSGWIYHQQLSDYLRSSDCGFHQSRCSDME